MKAVFIWQCGEEQIRDVYDLRGDISLGVVRPFVRFPSGDDVPNPREHHATVHFSITDQKRGGMPVYISSVGEEPWMRLLLARDRLRDELHAVEDEMIRKGIM